MIRHTIVQYLAYTQDINGITYKLTTALLLIIAHNLRRSNCELRAKTLHQFPKIT
jgi:hypothetical protein